MKQVPLLSWQEATRWHEIGYEYPIRNGRLVSTTAEVGALAFSLEVHGDSMESARNVGFYEGMIVIADPDEVARAGDFVIVGSSPHKEAVLRQLVSDGYKKYLKPLNPKYPIAVVSHESSVLLQLQCFRGVLSEKDTVIRSKTNRTTWETVASNISRIAEKFDCNLFKDLEHKKQFIKNDTKALLESISPSTFHIGKRESR